MSVDSSTMAPTAPQDLRDTPVLFGTLLLLACLCSAALLLGWKPAGSALIEVCDALTGGWNRCDTGVNKIRIYAFTLAMFPLILLLQRWRPADAHQPAFAPGVVLDTMWFIGFPILGVWLPTLVEDFLRARFGAALMPLQPAILRELPLYAQVIIVVLASDFLAWLSHLVRHKVGVFWEFHKIHHAQTQLNAFTTVRLHPLDLILNAVLRFLPFTLLGLTMGVQAFIGWIIFQRCYELFVHSNLRMNLGPLRYVFVTPQSHRVHHSRLRHHADRNFGDILSVWDFLFRTQVRDYQVYPPTGIHDTTLPAMPSARIRDGVRVYGRELMHPFHCLLRSIRQPGRGT